MAQIQVNMEAVEQNAEQSFTIARDLEPRYLSHSDTESTIQGAGYAKTAFDVSQNLIDLLGDAVEAEDRTIKNLGLRFKELDEMQAELLEENMDSRPTLRPLNN